MKLNTKAVANAAGVMGAMFFVGCYILVTVAPGLYRDIAQSWAHGVDISLIWRPRTGNFLVGFTSFTGLSWLSGWLFAFLHNRFTK